MEKEEFIDAIDQNTTKIRKIHMKNIKHIHLFSSLRFLGTIHTLIKKSLISLMLMIRVKNQL